MALKDQPPMEVGPLDADILWLLDLRAVAGVRPHDSAHSSILIDGPYLYVNTSNGLNSKHTGVDKPDAPSLVVVDKTSGELVAKDGQEIGPRIFHCTWSSPALGTFGGRKLILFGGGDGVCYAFDALNPRSGRLPSATPSRLSSSGEPTGRRDTGLMSLQRVWRFDCDPAAPKDNVHDYIRNRNESPSTIMSMPVVHGERVFLTGGGDLWWGKREAWLQCVDATGIGDVTKSGLIWRYLLERHCCSTPAVHKGLVYAADCGGKVHCVDAQTGEAVWVHDAGREIWASLLVADDKVYIGTRLGDFWVLAAGREKRVISSTRLEDAIISTAVAANGTLFVGTMTRLFALQDGAQLRNAQ
jgi:outer membrane protein assembly factor BamB